METSHFSPILLNSYWSCLSKIRSLSFVGIASLWNPELRNHRAHFDLKSNRAKAKVSKTLCSDFLFGQFDREAFNLLSVFFFLSVRLKEMCSTLFQYSLQICCRFRLRQF